MYRKILPFSCVLLILLIFSLGSTAQGRIDTDSLKQAIQKKRDSMIAANQQRLDSIRAETARRVDSLKSARAAIMDSIRKDRDRRLDSLAAIKKYRNSRHYKDSVAQVRQAFKDSIADVRLAMLDSIKLERLQFTDSLKQAREHIRDSIQTVISARRDSLLQLKNERLAAREKAKNGDKPMTEEERKKAAIDEKHEKKKEEYDNSQLLKKQWRFPRNALQNTYTRYNYYYNADLMYDEMLDRVYRLQKTDFDSIISVFRVSPKSASKYGGSTQDDIIKKASLDIQMHDPRSKWQDDLFFLIARSYFYKNDLDNSIPYTKYIITHFKVQPKKKKKGKRRKASNELIEKVNTGNGKSERVLSICAKEPKGFFGKLKHRPIHNDALLLLTRSYITEGYHTEALSLLNQMTSDINFPDRLRGESDRLLTQIYLQEDDYKQANEHLQNALLYTKGKKEKTRLYFLQGQIYQEYDKDDSAYYAFDRISKSNPDLDIEVQSYLKKTEIIYKNNWTQYTPDIERDMKKMLRQEKYRDYYGQIHFNKGMLAVIDQNFEEAEKEFTLSIETNSDSSSQYRALDQLISFYYDSDHFVKANQYLQQIEALPEIDNFKSKEDYVDHAYSIPALAENESRWMHADSLLYLATLSEKEQTKWAKAQVEKDTLSSGFQKLKPQKTQNSAGKSNFYFNNESLVKSGALSFDKTFGDIPNVDNWGVRTLVKFNPSTREEKEKVAKTVSEATGTYEKYLAKIPNTADQKAQVNFDRQEAIFNLGNISYRQLNDARRANKYFDTLTALYPLSEFRPKILFSQYLIAEKSGDSKTAEAYKSMLQAQYPGSYKFMFEEYIDGDNTEKKEIAAKKYQELYAIFKEPDFPKTKALYEADKTFFQGLPEYQNKSSLLYIQAEMGSKEFEQALKDVNSLIAKKPEQDVLSFAEELKRIINQKLGISDEKTNEDTTSKMDFEFNENKDVQMLLELDSTDVVSQVKIRLTDFNKLFFPNHNLSVSEKILPNKTRVVAVYNFPSFDKALVYKSRLVEQWDTIMRLPVSRQDGILFINSRHLHYLFGKNTYDQYKTFFNKKFSD